MLDIDLHCHSSCSDGTLTPEELVARAAERGVTMLALTEAGSAREEAYLWVQRAAMRVWDQGVPFRTAVAEEPEIARRLAPAVRPSSGAGRAWLRGSGPCAGSGASWRRAARRSWPWFVRRPESPRPRSS